LRVEHFFYASLKASQQQVLIGLKKIFFFKDEQIHSRSLEARRRQHSDVLKRNY
jgi:hypothetical protein